MDRFSDGADQIAVDVTETPAADGKIPTSLPPRTASQPRVLAGDRLTEVYASGRTRIPIPISNGTASLLADTVEIASALARGRVVEQLVQEVREEGADLLARSAVARSRRPV